MDVILNALLFVLLGLEVLVLRFRPGYFTAAALAIPLVLLVLLARLVSVAGAGALLRLARQRAEWQNVVLLTWGGLRGAISIALALELPHGPERDLLLAATYGVVAFSILVQGLKRVASWDASGHPCSALRRVEASVRVRTSNHRRRTRRVGFHLTYFAAGEVHSGGHRNCPRHPSARRPPGCVAFGETT